MKRNLRIVLLIVSALTLAGAAHAQSYFYEESFKLVDATIQAYRFEPPPSFTDPAPQPEPDPLKLRILKYAELSVKHRLSGLASYYSTSLDGTLTANGERYRNKKISAAHLTLPLGSWVEVTARATGRKLRLRVNDRGPYVNKFVIDLSQAAARYLGVDVAEDRLVRIRIIGLPGEEPLSQDVIDGPLGAAIDEMATLTPGGR